MHIHGNIKGKEKVASVSKHRSIRYIRDMAIKIHTFIALHEMEIIFIFTLLSQYPLGRRLGGSKSQSSHGREEKNLSPYWKLSSDCPAYSQSLY
jgi:hypothetical protein